MLKAQPVSAEMKMKLILSQFQEANQTPRQKAQCNLTNVQILSGTRAVSQKDSRTTLGVTGCPLVVKI